jgi:Mn-dependent DtxR family transcriptional regulator
MKRRARFSYQEKRIIKTLYRANRPLTTTQVARRAEMSWITADKYLKKLYRRRHVEKKKYGNAVYWRLYWDTSI